MKIAFVIPVHAPMHAKYSPEIAKFVSPFSDVYVILTTITDLEIWNLIPQPSVKTLVLSDWVSDSAVSTALTNKCMPTFKKWLGIAKIMADESTTGLYKFFITCDSEVKLVKPIDKEFVEALPSQFIFIGDHVSTEHYLYTISEQILGEGKRHDPEISDLAPPTKPCDDLIYTWWSGLPVYAADRLSEFLEHVGAHDATTLAKTLCWRIFDHLVYQRYTLRKGLHNAQFLCLTHDLGVPTGWSLEGYRTSYQAFEASRKMGLKTLWTNVLSRKLNPQAYILFHLDRLK